MIASSSKGDFVASKAYFNALLSHDPYLPMNKAQERLHSLRIELYRE